MGQKSRHNQDKGRTVTLKATSKQDKRQAVGLKGKDKQDKWQTRALWDPQLNPQHNR